MHHGFISIQLAVIDSFLAELAHGQPVNFNNTRQFDALLTHLEATLAGETFVLVPSVDVLHVLFTLAARSHRSNWTHAPTDVVGTHYMRQVNLDYDAAVTKSLLQERARQVLLRYVQLLERFSLQLDSATRGDEKDSTEPTTLIDRPTRSSSPDSNSEKLQSKATARMDSALRLLFEHMEQVVGALVPTRRNFFSAQPIVSPPLQPVVVEVISDSEGLDSLLEIEHPHAAARMVKEFSAPSLSATALSDLGTTSGLGEATALFTNMPHLLAHATPEPESEERSAKRMKSNQREKEPKAEPEVSKGDESRKYGQGSQKPGLDATQKIRKARPNPLHNKQAPNRKNRTLGLRAERIRVFDDVVLAQAVDPDCGYDIWALLRWCFTCAHTSTQYQAFLFNAAHTNVHYIYRAYEGVFDVVFRFMKVQQDSTQKNGDKGATNSLFDRALSLLGPRRDIYERAVEYIFTGLDQPTNATTYPCYSRERVLLKNDPAVQVSQCKTATPYVDNQHLMSLRAQIVIFLRRHEQMAHFGGEISVVDLLSAKLLGLRFCHVKAFFGTATVMQDPEFGSLLCSTMLSSITGMRLELEFISDASEQLTRVLTVVSDERLYSSISEDYSFGSFEAFWQRWQTALFLVQWLLGHALFRANGDETQIKRHCKRGDRHRVHYYNDFLDSRAEDADVQPEDLTFTLTQAERLRYREYSTVSFCEMIGC